MRLHSRYKAFIQTSGCHFEGGTTEKSPESGGCACEISPCSRNDNTGLNKLSLYFKGLQSILLVVLLAFTSTTSAQNTMQINNAQGFINDTLIVSLSITNDEEFISLQCDVLLPEGFTYVPGSTTLSSRAVDHVISATNTGNNSIRILSYSLNNTPFLSDSGLIAQFSLSTPSTAGDYMLELNNGIIGNAASVNILDSLIAGEVNLTPIGFSENKPLQDKIICFPNPFSENLCIQFNVDVPKTVNMQVFDVKGRFLSERNLELNNTGTFNLNFNKHDLLGNNPAHGTYFIHFGFQQGNQNHSTVKKIHFK